MKKSLSRITIVVFALSIASCASHKNFDYKTAYKFDRINYKNSVRADSGNGEIAESTTTDDNHFGNENLYGDLMPIGPQLMEEPSHLSSTDFIRYKNTYGAKQSFNAMTRAEKKELKRELRQTIRDFRNESLGKEQFIASTEGINNIQDDDASKKKRKIARYLLIGGGALLIIALIVGSVPVLGGVGAAAIIVGAVLMLLSLDK